MKTRQSLSIWAGAFAVVATALAAFAPTPAAFAKRPDAPSFTCTWTGATSTDWHTSANWTSCNGGFPNSGSDDAVLPGGGVTNEPTLNTGDATVNSLTVALGRTLTLSGTNKLNFNLGFNNAGLITGTGTLRANGTQNLAQTGTVNAALEVVTGTATSSSATYSGTLLVDAGASFRPDCHIPVTVVGDVTVNGTLGFTCGDESFVFKGASFNNNGTVALPNVTFSRAGSQSISGSGTWTTGSNLTIGATSATSTANPLTIAATTLTVNGGGTFSVTNPLTFTGSTVNNSGSVAIGATLLLSGSITLNNSGTGSVSGGGTFQTRGTIFLAQGGAFSAPVEVANGLTTSSSGVYSGTLLVDLGAIFRPDCHNIVTVVGDVTVNGTLGPSCGDESFVFKGASFSNNGSVSMPNVTFSRAGSQSISGSGAWTGTGSNLTIGATSATSTANPLTIAKTTLTVNGGGTLSVTNPLTFTGSTVNNSGSVAIGATLLLSGSITLNNSGTGSVSGGGTFQTRGTIFLAQGGAFSAPIEVAAGTTTGSSGVYSGTLLVDLGAIFSPDCHKTVTVVGDVTVNGTLGPSCGDESFVFKGASFSNNGSVSMPNVTFSRAGSQTISGPGAWTSTMLTIDPPSTTSLGSDIGLAVSTFTVNGAYSGGIFITAIDGATTLGGSGTVGFHGLTINAAHSLNANGTSFGVSGGWTNNGSFAAGGNTVTFNAAGTQTFTGNTTFNNLTVAVGASVDTGASIATVNGTFMDNGVMKHEAPAQDITFPSTFSYLDGRGFTTAQLTETGLPDLVSTTVSVVMHQAPTSVPCGSTTLGGSPVMRYYFITPTVSVALSLTLKLYYDPFNELNGNDPANIAVFHCDGVNWARIGTDATTGTDGGTGLNFIQVTGVTSLSPLAIGGAIGAPTEVKVEKFEASPAAVPSSGLPATGGVLALLGISILAIVGLAVIRRRH